MARTVRNAGRVDTVLVVVCVVLGAFAFFMAREKRERVASVLRTSALAPLVALEAQAASIRAAITERDDLLRERGSALTDTLNVRAVADENLVLRRLLGLSARLHDGFVPAELLPPRVGDEFTVALTAGSNVGVKPFLPVVTADGLVGMIESADATTSFAITWGHPDFRVSAMSADESAFGIVQPHLGAGGDRWLLEMRGVPFRAQLDSGALIVSSGLGSTYPRGIPVGTVIAELNTPEKWARTYLIKPAVLPAAIGPVLILMPARAARGVNGVWTTVAAADSAARRAAQSGDSLARKAALDELAARRAALGVVVDSLMVDSTASSLPGGISAGAVRNPRDSAHQDSLRQRSRADSVRGRPRPDSAGAVRPLSQARQDAVRNPLSPGRD